jgi:hypothetical protein
MLANMYALSKELLTVTTVLTAESSQLLGGKHLHVMFCLPLQKANYKAQAWLPKIVLETYCRVQ